jgi:hypothetical protein
MKRICALLLLLLAFTMTASQAKSRPDELSKISDQIDDGNGDEAEFTLLLLRERNSKDPEVLTLLARIE